MPGLRDDPIVTGAGIEVGGIADRISKRQRIDVDDEQAAVGGIDLKGAGDIQKGPSRGSLPLVPVALLIYQILKVAPPLQGQIAVGDDVPIESKDSTVPLITVVPTMVPTQFRVCAVPRVNPPALSAAAVQSSRGGNGNDGAVGNLAVGGQGKGAVADRRIAVVSESRATVKCLRAGADFYDAQRVGGAVGRDTEKDTRCRC